MTDLRAELGGGCPNTKPKLPLAPEQTVAKPPVVFAKTNPLISLIAGLLNLPRTFEAPAM